MAVPSAATQQAITDFLSTLGPRIRTRQDTYFANRGRYWQGLVTHVAIPIDGTSTVPDNDTAHPTDQIEPWNTAELQTPATWVCAVAVDVYQGPLGWGYVMQAYVRTDGGAEVWNRAANVGAETWRTHGWQLMGSV